MTSTPQKPNAVVFGADIPRCAKDFIALPKRLYSAHERTQDSDTEYALLHGTHILSRYFSVAPILVYRGGAAVSRAVVTVYPDDSSAYLGFFESENDAEAAALLFRTAERISKEKGCSEITGPVDCSFWIKYRLKLDRFGAPYTGEPYNKDYYAALWEQCGFKVCCGYSSNKYKIVDSDEGCEKYTTRLAEKLNEGYEIKSPTDGSFNNALEEVYSLMIELYSDFPTYKRITKSEFCSMFKSLKSIVNYNMVRLAYYKGKAVGFFVSVPNYGNLICGKLTPIRLARILAEKRKPRSYVMLYMGVDGEHRGLGKALAEDIRSELKRLQVPSVGALIRDGNINKNYMENIKDFEYRYVLFKKNI